ncbi:MAG: peptidoglycan-associated lipoprotein Pal [Desulfovibrionaceae bacterium]
MKSLTWMKVLVLLVLVMMVGAGCAKKQVASETPVEQKPAPAAVEKPKADTSSKAADEARLREAALAEAMAKAKAKISANVVYFDYDKFDLKPEARDVLKEKAALLKEYPAIKVLVEGHCDERGTSEYNLALGERRARAAYEFMMLLGVRANQLEMVSYGEEYPAVQGHNEAAWAKNRRDEFKIIQ